MDTATDQIENSLTSLMKAKFGVTRSSSVKLTEKDTLYTIFRKLADNIYKNGTWTQEDEIQAVDTLIRNRNNFSIDTEKIEWTDRKGEDWQANVSITPIDEQDKLTLGDRIDGKITYKTLVNRVNIENKEEKTKKTYVLLDPENKSGTKHAKFYYFGSGTKEQLNYFAIGNMNRSIGYDKLQRDILKEFENQKDSLPFKKEDLEGFIRKLSSSEYSGKANEPMFKKDFIGELTDSYLNTLPRDESMRYLGQPYLAEEMVKNGEVDNHNREWVEKQLATNWGDLTSDPDSKMKVNLDEAPYILQTGNYKRYVHHTEIRSHRKNNKIIDFVQKYVENTYDLILQVEYEKDIEKQTRASAWQTKKNINIETQKIMESTPLKKYFKFIELDNDVDLNLFGQFEQEMERIHEVLPETGNKSLELRLRKLGNYRALGMYVPTNNTIAIDFRDYGDDIGGVGIQSFIHEYAHALDYSLGNGRLLSMSDDFRSVVMKYRENLNLKGQNSYVAKKGGYYTTPTEVFARAFELYVSEAGFKSALLKPDKVYKTKLEYSLFDKNMLEEVSHYFDQIFPDLKTKINEFMKNSNEMVITEPTKSISSEGKQYKKIRNHEERKKLYNNAANKNIVDVAQSLGMGLKGRRSELYWEEHDSFKFNQKQNYFYWNSQRIGGGPIQLVRLIKKCTVAEAVDYLQDLDVSVFDASKIPPKKPFEYFMKESTDLSLTKDYLVNERKLSIDTVNFFISKGLIAQSTFKDKESGKEEAVIVFKHKDQKGKIKGVALQGIVEDFEIHDRGRLKKTFGDGFTGMSIKIGNPPSMKDATDEKPLKIIAFEAPIDLMSYYELHQESIGDAVLVSMNGLRKGTISKLLANSIASDITEEMKENYLDVLNKHYKPTNKVQITLAVDNDAYNEKTGVKAGQDFVDHFNVKVFPVTTHIPALAPNQTKNDWNEQLKSVKNEEDKKRIQELLGGSQAMSNERNVEIQEPDEAKLTKDIETKIENSQQVSEPFDEENLKSLLDGSSILEEKTPAEKDIFVSKSNKVTEEVSTLLENFKEDTDSILLQATKKPDQYLTKAEIEKILDEHMLKVEEAIKTYTTKFEDIKEPTPQETEQISKGIKDTIQSILEEFKHNLQKYILDKKNHTVSVVTEKVDDLRLDIRNAINKRILIVNDLVKKFAEKVDKKFAIDPKISKEELENNKTEHRKGESNSTGTPSKDLISAKEQHREQLIDARNRIIASKDFLRSNKLSGEKLSPVQKVKMYDQKINELDIEIEALKNKEVTTNVPMNKENSALEKDVEITKKAEKKQSQENNDQLKTLISKSDNPGITQYLNEKAKELMKEKIFKKYLDSASKFSKFSRSNIQLLMEQNPNATQVASINKWKELGFELKNKPQEMYVRTTLPTIKKDENGEPILDRNGEVVKEKREKLVPVFDVNEVIGDKKNLNRISDMTQNITSPQTFTKVFKTLAELTSAKVVLEPLPDSINSRYDSTEDKISIRPGLGEEATIKELIYVISTKNDSFNNENSKKEKFEADAVSYIIGSHLGMEVDSFTFDYLNDPEINIEEFIVSLEKITDQANKLVSQIDQKLEHSISKNNPKNKFEERLFKANMASEEPKKIAVKQESVDNPKVSSPSLSR
ncbi:DUF3991 domain-containing protein [Enterococcus hirae]